MLLTFVFLFWRYRILSFLSIIYQQEKQQREQCKQGHDQKQGHERH